MMILCARESPEVLDFSASSVQHRSRHAWA